MDELKKGLSIAVKGKEAATAVRAFRAQLGRWGIPLPPFAALVLDFGLGEFGKTGLVESWICNEAKAGYCGKYLFVSDGQSCPVHRHRVKHETFFILKGKVMMRLGKRRFRLEEGGVLPVKPGVLHGFTGIGPCLLVEISKPCVIADNYFDDRSIPIGGNMRRK